MKHTLQDLMDAFAIFRKYGNPEFPTHCEHDIMYFCGISPDKISDEDKKALSELGFKEGDGLFESTRFGSA